jgi:non-ribosomal peptide synthetase component F
MSTSLVRLLKSPSRPCTPAGDAVAINMPLCPNSVAALLGIVLAGCVAVCIADSFSAAEIASRCRIAGARAILTQARAAAAAATCGSAVHCSRTPACLPARQLSTAQHSCPCRTSFCAGATACLCSSAWWRLAAHLLLCCLLLEGSCRCVFCP